jgi:putative transposase
LMAAVVPSYKGFRFPVEIISHCVWLYHRFPLSLREVEEMMMARGVVVTYETIRAWCRTFGQTYANGLRRRRPRPGDKWHLDEVFIKINGKTHYLWRAVGQDGVVLDILVTSRRDAKAATRFFRKLLRGVRFVPRVLVTDKLASYGVAHRRLTPCVEHRQSKYLNNRAENVRREVARNEWITRMEVDIGRLRNSGKCSMPVPALACVMGNCGVRSRGKSPRVPVLSGGHRRGEGWMGERE